jgi:hypothetical protein
MYNDALAMSELLHETPIVTGATTTRRFISKSDETGGTTSNPDHRLDDLLGKINFEESLFHIHKQEKVLELQNAENGLLSADLLQAIEIANHGLIINTLGDYYAGLSQDFRDAGEFTKPSERPKWAFLGCSKYSEIIQLYDDEQKIIAAKGSGATTTEIPMTAAFALAYNYTGTRYTGVDEIVRFIRAYAERNITVHPVKKYFEEGDHNKLRIAMMRDYQCIPFLGNNASSDRKKQEVKTILNLVVRRFFSKWSWDEGGYYHESAAMRELRDKYEQRLRTKTVFFKNKSFDDYEHEKKGQASASTKKGDHTVEKSLAEGTQ